MASIYFFNIPSSLPVANRYDFNNSWNNIHVSHFNGKFKISFLINKQSSQKYNPNIAYTSCRKVLYSISRHESIAEER